MAPEQRSRGRTGWKRLQIMLRVLLVWTGVVKLFGNCGYGESIEIYEIGSPGGQNVGTPCGNLFRPIRPSNRPCGVKI